MTERSKRGLSLLALALAVGMVTAPTQAWARQDDAPAKKAGAGRKGKRMGAPQAFQTGLVVRVAVGVNTIIKVGENSERYAEATKLIVKANQVCARVLDSDAAPNAKKKRLLAAHQGLLRDMKALLPAQTWTKLVAAGDAVKAGELVLKVKTLKLFPLDDPFGKTSNLGAGEDPFGVYIGETEKNLLRSAPLGGDRIIADTPF